MLRIAQILSGLLALVLFVFAGFYIIIPEGAAAARGFDPVGEYGMTNIRILAAPFLMLAIMTAIGAVKKNYVFLAPAALYFLIAIVLRIVGIVADGADGTTVRVLVPAIVLFAIAEFALQVFKRASRNVVEAQPPEQASGALAPSNSALATGRAK